MKPLRLFEEVRIRNNERSKFRKILKKHFSKAEKEILKSELKCYDYQDVLNLLDDILEEIE